MTQLGKRYRGIWPEYPVTTVRLGDAVRYPIPGAIIRRGIIVAIRKSTVLFEGGGWCFMDELGQDKD